VPELVIFDCDGVLVDSEPISNRVLAEMLGDEGLSITAEQARREYQGLLLRDVVAHAERALGRPLPERWDELYEERRDAAFARELRVVADADGAVAAVRAAGMDACVASQGRLSKTRLSLAVTGLDALFDPRELFSAETVPRGKPHPDLFLHAAREMGSAPADAVVVEDTPTGVTAGVAAGMRVLGYAADSDEAALRAAGAETFTSMVELPGRLGVA
jgi:beta-phosphoglucomutase-like phosphatase (HAD superfamily)